MKVQSKDTIIFHLIELLQNIEEDHDDYKIQTGWIEALMWTIGLKEEEKKNEDEIKYCIQDIIFAIDTAIGDDGNRSEEIVAILENEF